MSSHIIYHPRRRSAVFGRSQIYFDTPRGNQDPYIWNTRFLHTYCHMTELRAPAKGDINFWVSGDCFPDFHHLYCDLVFVVSQVHVWKQRNQIEADDALVESPEAFTDHYMWAEYQHRFISKTRKTLKAHFRKSFQPQDGSGGLINLLPFLQSLGWSVQSLRAALKKGRGSKPLPIDFPIAQSLYRTIIEVAPTKLFGKRLQSIRKLSPNLASPAPKCK